MKRISWIIGILLLIVIGCEPQSVETIDEEQKSNDELTCEFKEFAVQEPSFSPFDLPTCRLKEELFSSTYGSTSKVIFKYSESSPSGFETYRNGSYSFTRFFHYDREGESVYEIKNDSSQCKIDTISSYHFEEGLLIKYLDYDNNKIEVENRFQYESGNLSKTEVISPSGKMIYEYQINANGNIDELRLVKLNGSTPQKEHIYTFTYDDRPNPYFQLPYDFGIDFFCPNNQISAVYSVDGVIQDSISIDEYTYSEGLLSKVVDSLHTTQFVYECD